MDNAEHLVPDLDRDLGSAGGRTQDQDLGDLPRTAAAVRRMGPRPRRTRHGLRARRPLRDDRGPAPGPRRASSRRRTRRRPGGSAPRWAAFPWPSSWRRAGSAPCRWPRSPGASGRGRSGFGLLVARAAEPASQRRGRPGRLVGPARTDRAATLMAASVFRGGIDSEAARSWSTRHGRRPTWDSSTGRCSPSARTNAWTCIRWSAGTPPSGPGAAGLLETLRHRHADHFRRWIGGGRPAPPRLRAANLAAPARDRARQPAGGAHLLRRSRRRRIRDRAVPGPRRFLVDPRASRRGPRTRTSGAGSGAAGSTSGASCSTCWGSWPGSRATTTRPGSLLTEALPLHQAAGDDEATGAAQHRLGSIAGYEGDYAEAERLYRRHLGDEGPRRRRGQHRQDPDESGHHRPCARATTDRAETLHQQALAAFQAHQHEHFSAISLTNLGDLAIERGDADAAEAYYPTRCRSSSNSVINNGWRSRSTVWAGPPC